MESAEFLIYCKEIIDDGKLYTLLLELRDEKNLECVLDCGWELVAILSKYLSHKDESISKTCIQCLHQLIEVCNTKEILLGLTETLATVSSTIAFQGAVQLISKALLKLSRRQSKYYEDICEQIVSHIQKSIKTRDAAKSDDQFENNEMLHCFVTTIDQFLTVLSKDIKRRKFNTLDEFRYEESFVLSDLWQEHEVLSCRDILTKFILNFLAITVGEIHDDHLQNISAKILNLTSFVDLADCICIKTHRYFNSTGFIVFLHNILVKKRYQDFPFVFSFRLLFKLIIFHSSSSLESSNQASVLLNLELLQFILNLMKNDTSFKLEDFDHAFQKTALELTNVMIWCQDEALRKQSRDVFLSCLTTLVPSSCFSLLRYVYKISEHPPLLGFLITQKNICLQQMFKDDRSDSDMTRYDVDIGDLSLEFIKFIPGDHNILHDLDRLMAGLNFLRFWLLKDSRKMNKTGIWEKLDELNHQFQIFYNSIDISRSEFQKAIRTLEESGNIVDKGLIQLVIPGGDAFNSIPREKKIEVIQNGCLRLDMMSSILSRIQDIIKENEQKD